MGQGQGGRRDHQGHLSGEFQSDCEKYIALEIRGPFAPLFLAPTVGKWPCGPPSWFGVSGRWKWISTDVTNIQHYWFFLCFAFFKFCRVYDPNICAPSKMAPRYASEKVSIIAVVQTFWCQLQIGKRDVRTDGQTINFVL